MMTRKARALGMSHTVYVKRLRLPDDDPDHDPRATQVTLSAARFRTASPRYYRYFQTASFSYRGHAIAQSQQAARSASKASTASRPATPRASGFNLVSSVRRGNRHIVAAVLGGASGGARDARMRSLIETTIASAATTRTAARIGEATEVAGRKACRADAACA